MERMLKFLSTKSPSVFYGLLLIESFVEFSELISRAQSSIEDKALQQSYLIMLHELLPQSRQEKFYQLIRPMLSLDVDRIGKKNANYEYRNIIIEEGDLDKDEQFDEVKALRDNEKLFEHRFGKSISECSREEIEELLPELYLQFISKLLPKEMGHGLQAHAFMDLMKRRHNFVENTQSYAGELRDCRNTIPMPTLRNEATRDQQFLATKLRQSEDRMLACVSLDMRIEELLSIAPVQTVVRDIYLEKFAEDELKDLKDKVAIMKVCDTIWSLMTDACPSKEALAIRYLDASFELQPELLEDYENSMRLVVKYLPKASFARNSYLDKIELKADLKVERLRVLNGLRFSDEGKEDKDDNGFKALITGKINEMNRSERMSFYFWLTGMKSKKPINILNLERQVYGDAGSFKVYFASLKSQEQALLVKRLSLGAEGIFDLETVGHGVVLQAQSERAEFVDYLLVKIIERNGEKNSFISGILRSLLLSAEPAKAAEILGLLTSKLAEVRVNEQQINMPETMGIVLGSLGVVGKKLGQSLAELDIVPLEYREVFKKMQRESTVVPKHALAELADYYGLLEGKDGLRIIGFERMLGAASNKQACLLEVEVVDSRCGLPIGRHRLVGKFKRPSAQKSANLDKDLALVEKIISDLSDEKELQKMPPGFVDSLKDAVLRELDFEKEAVFARQLRGDFAKLEQSGMEYKLCLPKIVYASNDLVLETLASGISLREFIDGDESGNLAEGYEKLDLAQISKNVLSEALRELLVSGNVHADLHPGNIFVDVNKNITFIDVGMNESLSLRERGQVGKLLLGLISGSAVIVKSALADLGMRTSGKLSLSAGKFENNVNEMIHFAKSSGMKLPGLLTSVLSSISKLSTYAKFLKLSDMAAVMREVGQMYGENRLGIDGFDLEDLSL